MNVVRLRLLFVILIVGMSLSFAGCGGDAESGISGSTAGVTPNQLTSDVGYADVVATVGVSFSYSTVEPAANSKTVTYSISGKPSWATFNTLTGVLSGTPNEVGTFTNIAVTVTDGGAITVLPSFTLAVRVPGYATLSWVVPTVNTDGSALTDLAGYLIHYGTDPDVLSNTVRITAAEISTHTIYGLNAGVTYYFAMVSVNTAGVSSELSDVGSMKI